MTVSALIFTPATSALMAMVIFVLVLGLYRIVPERFGSTLPEIRWRTTTGDALRSTVRDGTLVTSSASAAPEAATANVAFSTFTLESLRRSRAGLTTESGRVSAMSKLTSNGPAPGVALAGASVVTSTGKVRPEPPPGLSVDSSPIVAFESPSDDALSPVIPWQFSSTCVALATPGVATSRPTAATAPVRPIATQRLTLLIIVPHPSMVGL